MPADGERGGSWHQTRSSVKTEAAKPPSAEPFNIVCSNSLGAEGRQGRRLLAPVAEQP